MKIPPVAVAILAVGCIALPALADQAQATTPPAKTGSAHTTEKTAKQRGKNTSPVIPTSANQGHATTHADTPPETKGDEMGMHAHHSEAAASAKAATDSAKAPTDSSKTPTTTKPAAAAIYVCPMHPEVTSDKKDRCQKCKMFLEPKKQ